jgi:hypothetical protein
MGRGVEMDTARVYAGRAAAGRITSERSERKLPTPGRGESFHESFHELSQG